MPSAWYTPREAPWHMFELQARGLMARAASEVDSFRASDELVAGKRKAEAQEERK